MQIHYVVSTMLFWWRENNLSFEQECQFLKSLGFGIELWPTIRGQDDCRYIRRNWPRLASATENMLVVMRSRNDDPNLDQWKEQIECAKLLEADIITDTISLGIPDSPDINGCDFSDQIVRFADDHDVKIAVETGQLEKIKAVGKKFDSLTCCLDTGYAYIDKTAFERYVDELADKITHLHLTDNFGRIDDHEPPGLKGGIPRKKWDYLLNKLTKQDRPITASLEMYPAMPRVMLHQACDFLFEDLKWPDCPQYQTHLERLAYNPV